MLGYESDKGNDCCERGQTRKPEWDERGKYDVN
jgi:hypothetical protein